MQVSHQNDHITHAVIGGKQAIEFGISNSAEFFNILSSTLYKDQILAVVREVLCNAWDAHIEAGCTNRAVQITLTNDTFTIKDFGKGIHHDDMGMIYGTYGNSTKKNDGNQTGGFGLGCKAPFAYTDHFEVVSSHAGIRTIYNLSKSSAQAMGKPGIIPIASFPSDESGLTVTIRIKPQDHERFSTLIRRVAHNGDMNMQLNGEQLTTLDFDVSQRNFLLTRARLLDAHYPIMIRYGNVIYPVESSGNDKTYLAIRTHLYALPGSHTPFCIVFQAPPHSIAVTPSRESLSMQEHTIKTLGTLFKGFLDSLEGEFKEACAKYTASVVQKAVTDKRIDELLKREVGLPRVEKADVAQVIRDFDTMAKTFMQANYPKGLDYRREDITRRLEAMVQNNLLDRGKAASFIKELKQVKTECTAHHSWHNSYEKTNWLQRNVMAPVLKKLLKEGLPTNQLFSCNKEDHQHHSSKRDGVPPLVPATKASPHHLLVTLPYLRNIVVISTRRQDLVPRAYSHEVFKKAGCYLGFLVYLVSRKKGELAAVRAFFAQQGMVVVDLTLMEDEEKKYSTIRDPRVPTKKGVVQLSATLCDRNLNLARMQYDTADRIEDPKFMLLASLRNNVCSVDSFSNKTSSFLVQLFGKEGGVTNSTSTYNKWISKGAVPFIDYVIDKVTAHILNNPRFEAHMAQHANRVCLNTSHQESAFELITRHEPLAKEYGLTNPLTDEDKKYLAIWETLTRSYNTYLSDKRVKAVIEWLNNIPSSPKVIKLVQQLDSMLLEMLDISEVQNQIHHSSPAISAKAIAFFKSTLNP